MWTAEQAREMAVKGGQAFARKMAEAKTNPPPPESPPEPDKYVQTQLKRVRKQIDMLNDMLESPEQMVDAKAVKALCDAKARLYEVEAALAGRPKPGNLRPNAPKQSRRPGSPPGLPEPPSA